MLGNTNGNMLTNAAGATINTTGAFNDGMAANGSGNTLINNGAITTAGPNAYGMTAAWGQTNTGQLNNTLINTGTVSTSGSNARAASILGGSGTINNSGTLSTTGTSSNGAYLQGNNDRLINSGKIIATGASSDAVFSNTVSSSFTATIQNLGGGQIISQNASAIRTLNANTTIINAGLLQSNVGTAITMGNGNNSLVLQTGSNIIGSANGGGGSNTVTLQGTGIASNAFLNFQTLIMQGTLWNWTGSGTFTTALLQSGTLNLTGTLGASPAVNVSAGATLNMAGVSQTFGSLNNAGTIFTNGAGPGTTLTVAGNYVGAGGNIVLNTFLGPDNSPSDRLVISNGGTATGMTMLTIHNTTGTGNQTTANGILVVNAINGATTAAGAFTLAPGELRGGAYDYRLFQGGISGGDPNDWFLRSTFLVSPLGPSPEPTPTPSNVLPPNPPPSVLPPGLYPIIGPGLATYGVVQPLARQLGFTTLGTLNQRIGDTMTLANAGTDNPRSDWMRVFGQQVDNRYQAFADPRASGWVGGFQGGFDVWRGSPFSGHRDAAGIYFAYDHSSMNVNGLVTNPAATGYVLTHTGTVNLDAYSGGAYWTHYGPAGWYLDAVLQGTVYNGTASTGFSQLPTGGVGFIASLEAGYPIRLPLLGPNFVLEPQAQIIWQQVTFSDANDGLGAVALGTTAAPTGRLGVRGQWNIVDERGSLWQPYTGVNFWQDWSGQATTTFSGVDQVLLDEQATRVEFLAGMTGKLNDRLSIYSQGSYQFALNSTNEGIRRNGFQGDVGVRYAW
jgi:outer membrane autotransporter protein